ncbi:hypothetical protein BKA69DRAFT_759022 [Paraphysoderma sedebokerense]|nr:hypothetical protein BKA69DRAFT_759022 [Paraphysoderma sedebokerense]
MNDSAKLPDSSSQSKSKRSIEELSETKENLDVNHNSKKRMTIWQKSFSFSTSSTSDGTSTLASTEKRTISRYFAPQSSATSQVQTFRTDTDDEHIKSMETKENGTEKDKSEEKEIDDSVVITIEDELEAGQGDIANDIDKIDDEYDRLFTDTGEEQNNDAVGGDGSDDAVCEEDSGRKKQIVEEERKQNKDEYESEDSENLESISVLGAVGEEIKTVECFDTLDDKENVESIREVVHSSVKVDRDLVGTQEVGRVSQIASSLHKRFSYPLATSLSRKNENGLSNVRDPLISTFLC